MTSKLIWYLLLIHFHFTTAFTLKKMIAIIFIMSIIVTLYFYDFPDPKSWFDHWKSHSRCRSLPGLIYCSQRFIENLLKECPTPMHCVPFLSPVLEKSGFEMGDGGFESTGEHDLGFVQVDRIKFGVSWRRRFPRNMVYSAE